MGEERDKIKRTVVSLICLLLPAVYFMALNPEDGDSKYFYSS
jgi:hypothetical protein